MRITVSGNNIYYFVNGDLVGAGRFTKPAAGFLYVPLYDDRPAAQPQLYDGSNWIDVTAMVHAGNTTVNVLGHKFSPVGDAPDVDIAAKPERPTKPGEDVDPDTCTHDWKEPDRTDAACSVPGSIEYTYSKCNTTKKEQMPKLGHTWEVKQTVQTTYDENC